ncbi:transglutaminase domain-containing protein [Flintibacter muris]|uniref:transglutaminase domain-containing protein n=1 Tax=Flintibacter muris TaxID=2941327 RepID=UPI0020414AB5|nr:transglutaminase domain-containing protein [Flintibacter muris]
MKSKKIVSLLLTGAMTAALLAVPAQAAEAPQPEPYTISVDHWSREDFSQEANPSVFTGVYDRALYNTIRQTIVDGTSETAPAYTMVSKEDYSAVKNLIGRMEGVLRYEHHVPRNFTNYWQYLDYFAVSAEMPENYQAPLDFIQPALDHAGTLATDRERVEYFNDYIRSLLAYQQGKVSGITQTFAPHAGELKAACGSYARAMKFLCAAADIPCFTISTKTHTWNLVYVEGQWLHVDVSANDLSGRNGVLLIETYGGADQALEATAFLKELYVPGSTK